MRPTRRAHRAAAEHLDAAIEGDIQITERLPAGTGPAIERLRGYRAPVPRDPARSARLRGDLLEAHPKPRRSLSTGWLAAAWRPAGAVALAAVTVVGTGSYLRERLHTTVGSSGQARAVRQAHAAAAD